MDNLVHFYEKNNSFRLEFGICFWEFEEKNGKKKEILRSVGW